VADGLAAAAAQPFVDGYQLDWEHFPRFTFYPEALTETVCAIQAGLHAQGQRLHSMDFAMWGTWGFFNVTALQHCMDHVLAMGYVDAPSRTVAVPTDPLSIMKRQIATGGRPLPGIWDRGTAGTGFTSQGVSPGKLVLGLAFFGYDFVCTNPAPVSYLPYMLDGNQTAPTCELPPTRPCTVGHCNPRQSYPMITHFEAMQLFASKATVSGKRLGYHTEYASAWFEYVNSTSGQRHQVFFNDERAIEAKSAYAFDLGMHGVATYDAAMLYDAAGTDSAGAQAMWKAAAAPRNASKTQSV
jgi:hypothetical protein